MVDLDPAFYEKFRDVAIRQFVAEIPAHGQQDHIGREPLPGERSGLDKAVTIHQGTPTKAEPIRQCNGARQSALVTTLAYLIRPIAPVRYERNRQPSYV